MYLHTHKHIHTNLPSSPVPYPPLLSPPLSLPCPALPYSTASNPYPNPTLTLYPTPPHTPPHRTLTWACHHVIRASTDVRSLFQNVLLTQRAASVLPGMCSEPTGAHDCTWSFEPAGEVLATETACVQYECVCACACLFFSLQYGCAHASTHTSMHACIVCIVVR